MATKSNKLESALVSMAGTLIYLQELESTLTSKPMVPKAVSTYMARTQAELDVLKAQCNATRLAATNDADPLLATWLEQLHIPVGGILAANFWTYSGMAKVQGGVARATLHPFLLVGLRVVDIVLEGAEICLPDGRVIRSFSELSANDQFLHQTVPLRECEHTPPDRGSSRVLHVYIPIQDVNRKTWARKKCLELR